MDTIENPSANTLDWVLLPVIPAAIARFFFKTVPLWLNIVEVAPFVIFMILITYFCIKQKCYRQLYSYWLSFIILGTGFVRIIFY